MSTHYLIDLHTNPFSLSKIIDTVESDGSPTLTNGHAIIRVPEFIQIEEPVDLTDLISKKYQGILSYYAGFQYITYDDLLDNLSVDIPNPLTRGLFGDRNLIVLPPTGGRFISTAQPLSGPNPTQAVVTWEVYSISYDDPKNSRCLRYYNEESSSLLTAQVSFNGGTSFNSTSDNAVLNIPLLDQGNSFVIDFINTHPTNKYFLGSWSVVY